MPDAKTKKISQDGSRISLEDQHEVGYWPGKSRCTEPELKQVVDVVRYSAGAVRAWIRRRRGTDFGIVG